MFNMSLGHLTVWSRNDQNKNATLKPRTKKRKKRKSLDCKLFQNLVSIATNQLAAHNNNYHWRELTQVSLLSRQTYACYDKTLLWGDKSMFGAKKLLSRQYYVCRVKTFVATNITANTCLSFCRDKNDTCIILSWQKPCFGATNTCLSRQNIFFTTSILLSRYVMILVAAPANATTSVLSRTCCTPRV